jgi:ABC-2 type transport system ATP-binding protein
MESFHAVGLLTIMAGNILEITDLKKVYHPSFFARTLKKRRAFAAVDGLSFALKTGEILGFLGPNGAGKTTTINMLLGTLTPTSGSITYYGKDFAAHRSEILQLVGFASTYVSLPRRLTVLENLHVYGRLFSMTYDDRVSQIEKMLRQFALWDLRNQEVGSLSAGQVARVMIAKAFMARPKIVLLDEPTAALDPDIAQEVRSFIGHQQAAMGTSILFASHNMQEVTQLCDRVIVMQKGRIFDIDTPENLARRISLACLELLVCDSETMHNISSYVTEQHLKFHLEGKSIRVHLDEHAIASFLTALGQRSLMYDQITIEKPTLEHYFLHIARTQNNRGPN